MQYIFGILDAYWSTLGRFCFWYLKFYQKLPQPTVIVFHPAQVLLKGSAFSFKTLTAYCLKELVTNKFVTDKYEFHCFEIIKDNYQSRRGKLFFTCMNPRTNVPFFKKKDSLLWLFCQKMWLYSVIEYKLLVHTLRWRWYRWPSFGQQWCLYPIQSKVGGSQNEPSWRGSAAG